MFHQHDGDALTIAQLPHESHHALDICMVHAGHRLIQQQQARFRRQADRHLQDPFETVRQTAGQLLLSSGQAGEPDDLVCPLHERIVMPADGRRVEQPGPESGACVNVQTGEDTAQNGESRKQLGVLECPHQAAAHQIVHRYARDIAALEPHPSGGRRQHATDQVEQRGLPGAVWPDQATNFARLDRQ